MIDVTVDRNKYIGGSDIPVILGISPFRTRYDLLLEKAEIEVNGFEGNQYTEYGNILEPKIRDYVNQTNSTNYQPQQLIQGFLRGNCDGFNGESILEIKTTSRIHRKIEKYELYKVQLLFYMDLYGVDKGILAVYKRPKDFNTDFDVKNLHIYEFYLSDEKETVERIKREIQRFWGDLERLKNNPLLSEKDFEV